jgi:hypothetical protein
MQDTTDAPLDVSGEELEIRAELLESARAKLMIEIRHTDYRSYRDQLRERWAIVERLEERCKSS